MNNEYEVRGDVVAIFLDRRDGSRLETIIDAADFDIAMNVPWKWCPNWSESGKRFYACGIHKRTKGYRLHRIIIDAPDGLDVDHINGDTLDNRRANLQLISRTEHSTLTYQRLRDAGKLRHPKRTANPRIDRTPERIRAIRAERAVRGGGGASSIYRSKSAWVARFYWQDKRMYIGAFRSREAAVSAIQEIRA